MSSPTAVAADQPQTPVFSIPAALFASFSDRPVILRTADPAAPRALLGPEPPAGLVYLQLTDITGDMAPLADWGDGVPLDLVLADPEAELGLLYRCTGLLARHPVRVSVPFRAGLGRAVKLALSLGFAVRLHGHRPTPQAIAEARSALDDYLHNPTVSQPVEPFHSLLGSLLHATPVSLWSLLEQDPADVCLIDDQGNAATGAYPVSVGVFRDALLAAAGECRDCPWLTRCDSYFKWPGSDYACTDVKRLFSDLEAAAGELRTALDDHAVMAG
jgi:hypothetical protein